MLLLLSSRNVEDASYFHYKNVAADIVQQAKGACVQSINIAVGIGRTSRDCVVRSECFITPTRASAVIMATSVRNRLPDHHVGTPTALPRTFTERTVRKYLHLEIVSGLLDKETRPRSTAPLRRIAHRVSVQNLHRRSSAAGGVAKV